MSREEEKKSSGVAKAGLTLGIIGTSLAALGTNGISNNGNGCNGGLLGGLFGNNGAVCAYEKEKSDRNAAAATELTMVNSYVLPLMGQISEIQAKLAVNDERDAKNEVINGLLFKMADQYTDTKFAESKCCCEKNQIYMNQLYDKLDAADKYNYTILDNARQCTYDRLSADTTCNFNRLNDKIDANFKLRDAIVDGQFAAADAKLQQSMCGVIKGTPYLSASQLADPYTSGYNVLMSRHVTPVVATYGGCGSTWNTGGCGCQNDWAW